MYIALFARQDLLRAVGALTTMITRWDELCDRKLFRIIKYINGAVEWQQVGFVGDTTEHLQLGLFSDADFAGDRADMNKPIGCVFWPYMAHTAFPALRAEQKANGGVTQHRRGRNRGGRPRSSNERAASLTALGKVTGPPIAA